MTPKLRSSCHHVDPILNPQDSYLVTESATPDACSLLRGGHVEPLGPGFLLRYGEATFYMRTG